MEQNRLAIVDISNYVLKTHRSSQILAALSGGARGIYLLFTNFH
jgi:hypothetical protein